MSLIAATVLAGMGNASFPKKLDIAPLLRSASFHPFQVQRLVCNRRKAGVARTDRVRTDLPNRRSDGEGVPGLVQIVAIDRLRKTWTTLLQAAGSSAAYGPDRRSQDASAGQDGDELKSA